VSLVVVVVYPDLLGTYGDGGNGLILGERARWRGIGAEVVEAESGRPLPTGDLYCLGGGEDGPQLRAAELLRADGGLRRGIERGACMLAVCAGYQIVGRTFPAADGRGVPGVGLLDVSTVKGTGRRAVGELLADPVADAPALTGFENHGGRTRLGPGATPLARVRAGVGNGDGTEGALQGRVVGTYLHGPVLARNPALADQLLGWATGLVLDPLDDAEEQALRAERLSAARYGRLAAVRNGRLAQVWRARPAPVRRPRSAQAAGRS
jgi:CobQ-like glutamine amidotransferase family enzyme